MKKRLLAMLVAVLSISMVLTGCQKKPKDAVATIDGEYITVDDIQPIYEMIKNQYGGEALFNDKTDQGKEMIHRAKVQATQEVINTKVMEKLAKDYEVTVDEAKIDEKLEEIKAQFGGEEVFNQIIQQDGMSVDELKENIRKNLVMAGLNDKLVEKYQPSEEDITKEINDNKKKYTQYNANHILIKNTDEAGQKLKGEELNAKKAEAEEILKEIKDGGDFEAIAKEKSQDGSKENGGNLGNFYAEKMVKPFAKALEKLEVGQVSEIVETEFGYHIIKLNTKEEDPEKFDEEYKKEISEEIKSTTIQENAQKELEKTKKAMKARIFENAEGLKVDKLETEEDKKEDAKEEAKEENKEENKEAEVKEEENKEKPAEENKEETEEKTEEK